jgi:galactokinase/mevalonate kinase-like predicted kinase
LYLTLPMRDGGKVSGGGGFMMDVVDPDRKARLMRALSAAGGMPDRVGFTNVDAESWIV